MNMVMQEIKHLFQNVPLEEIMELEVNNLCNIIVNGKQSGYKFTRGPLGELYPGTIDRSNGKYLIIGLSDLMILEKVGLVEINMRDEEAGRYGFLIQPTKDAMEFYERLGEENLLDSSGYLKRND